MSTPPPYSEEVSDELLDQVLATLVVADGDRLSIEKRLRRIGEKFLGHRSIQPYYASPKEQRAAIKRLRNQTEKLVLILAEIAPEYAVSLHALANIPTGGDPLVIELQRLLLGLLKAAIEFEENFEPPLGPPVDWPLEEAVIELLQVVQQVTGELPAPSMKKSQGTNPELLTAGAKAIGNFLRGLDAKLTNTKIANMMLKVAAHPHTSDTPLDSLLKMQMDAEYGLLRSPPANRD